MKELTSYDIVAKAVKDYVDFLIDMDWQVDYAYIVHFYQSYNPVTQYEECTEICFYTPGDDDVTFDMDFCEGQKYVMDLSIIPLYKVGEIMRECIRGVWPYVKDNYYKEVINEDK